jgi:hypothetical protein
VVQTVTSSIVYSSGSNIFGSQITDRQTFTGSLQVTGSANFSGSIATSGNITLNKTAPNIWMRGGYTQDLAFFLNNEPSVYIVDDATATKGIKINISTGAITQLGGGASSFSGSVGIGTTNPLATLHIASTNLPVDSVGNLLISSTNALTSGAGGIIGFGGIYTSGGTVGAFANIGAKKDNATTGNASGYLYFGTTSGTTLTERMRITSGGTTWIGSYTANPSTTSTLTLGKSAAPTGYTSANTYLQIGGMESSGSSTRLIGFGYSETAQAPAPPAYIGYITSNTSGFEYGDLIFGTRSVTTNTAATERMRITNDGITKFIFASDRGIRMTGTLSTESVLAGYQAFTENIRELRIVGSTLFFNTGDGSNSTGTERMRISEAGLVGIGNTTPSAVLNVTANSTNAQTTAAIFNVTNTAANGSGVRCQVAQFTNNAGSAAYSGYIYIGTNPGTDYKIGKDVNGTGTSKFNITTDANSEIFSLSTSGVLSTPGGGTSDARVKQNIEQVTDNATTILNALKPSKFQFKEHPTITRHGFIAQDVLEVKPDLVLGDEDLYGLDYDGILTLAVKAIQELEARVKELETK